MRFRRLHGLFVQNEIRQQTHLQGGARINERGDHMVREQFIAQNRPAGKPAPDIYLLVAETLGVKPEECLVFEDVPMGILAGKNAGMRVCAVEDTFSASQREEKKELADYYIESYDEIPRERMQP